jgi:RNA polymerase sigma factor (sigma-70 family)
MSQAYNDQERQFKELLPRIRLIVSKRKGSWTLSTLPWEDVESILITRIWQQLPMYNVERPFDNWANRLISNTISNLLRDLCFKHARPCIASGPAGGLCVFNEGGDRCGYTESRQQCRECPLYAKWERKKQAAHNINSSLPLEHHDMEVQNIQEDFLDIAAAKLKIDARIIAQLNAHDAKVYKLLFIDHLSMEEVSKRMKYKTQSNSKVGQVLRKLVAKFKELARQAINNEDLV